jgi:transposase-like protein
MKAIESNSKPERINIDKRGANTAGIKRYNRKNYSKIKIRQCKYLNTIVAQDHRMIKWRIILGLGFKEFESAKRTISGIEVLRMIKKINCCFLKIKPIHHLYHELRTSRFKSNFYNYIWRLRQNLLLLQSV